MKELLPWLQNTNNSCFNGCRTLSIGEDDDDSEEGNASQLEDTFLIDPRKCPLYDVVIEAYAALLYRWKMLRQHAEVLKSLSQPRSQDKYVMTVSVPCTSCGRFMRGHACTRCRCVPVRCAVCRLPCRGMAALCLSCGHGGHAAHLNGWFRGHAVCPSGCGCPCLTKRQL